MGTIAEKLSYLDGTREQILTNINALGGDLTEEDTFRSYANELDNMWEELPHSTGEGETLSLNTKKGKMKVNLLGNVSQYTTTGKNKLDLTGITTRTIAAGITITPNFNGNILQNIRISGTPTATAWQTLKRVTLAAGSYILTGINISDTSKTGLRIGVYIDSSTQYFIHSNLQSINFTINEQTSMDFVIWVQSVDDYPTGDIYITPMIRLSSVSDATYEPYTNGASPNPTYPQDIHIVSGDNTINDTGKNLLPSYDGTSQTISGVTFTKNNDGTITANGTATAGINYYINGYTYATYTPNTYTLSDGIGATGGESSTTFFIYFERPDFTYPLDTYAGTTHTYTESFRGRARIVVRNGVTLNNVVFKPMINVGSTAGDYEPYTSTSYPIHLGMENLWKNQLTGWLPQSGAYPTTNSSFPNARYVLVYLYAGQKLTLSNSTSNQGRVRCIDIDTNQVVNAFATLDTEYYTTTHSFGDGFYEGTITAKKNFIAGILDISGDVNDLVVNYGLKQTISDTPIELCKIGDYKDRFIRTTGKNLFDLDNAFNISINATGGTGTNNDYRTTDYLPTQPNTNYYFSTTQKSGQTSKQIYIAYYDSDKTFISRPSYNELTKEFTTPSNCYYMRAGVYVAGQENIMLNEGSTALPYEPYGTNEWYLEKNFVKLQLTGSLNWLASGNGRWWYTVDYQAQLPKATNGEIMSNCFTKGNWNHYDDSIKPNIICLGNDGNGLIGITQASFGDLNAMKTYMNNNDVYAYAKRISPTYTPITGTLKDELEAVWRANSYNGTTNISQVNNDLPFELIVKGLAAESDGE